MESVNKSCKLCGKKALCDEDPKSFVCSRCREIFPDFHSCKTCRRIFSDSKNFTKNDLRCDFCIQRLIKRKLKLEGGEHKKKKIGFIILDGEKIASVSFYDDRKTEKDVS